VDQLANLHWVQPRVLDKAQVTSLGSLLSEWLGTVEATEQLMKEQTPEFFAA